MIFRKKEAQAFAAIFFSPLIALAMIKTFLRIRKDLTMPNREMYE